VFGRDLDAPERERLRAEARDHNDYRSRKEAKSRMSQNRRCVGAEDKLSFRARSLGIRVYADRHAQRLPREPGGLARVAVGDLADVLSTSARRRRARTSGYSGEAAARRARGARHDAPRLHSRATTNCNAPRRELYWLDLHRTLRTNKTRLLRATFAMRSRSGSVDADGRDLPDVGRDDSRFGPVGGRLDGATAATDFGRDLRPARRRSIRGAQPPIERELADRHAAIGASP